MWYGMLMLAGLIWLAPFDTKSLCPHTRLPDLASGENSKHPVVAGIRHENVAVRIHFHIGGRR